MKFNLDRLAQSTLKSIAARSTRRSALGKLAKATFGLLGIKLVSLGPMNRIFAQAGGTPQYCGLYGWPCSQCPEGSDDQCPVDAHGCIAGGSSWIACCHFEDDIFLWVDYADCCTTGPTPTCGTKIENGTDCDPNKVAWCNEGNYCCTTILIIPLSC